MPCLTVPPGAQMQGRPPPTLTFDEVDRSVCVGGYLAAASPEVIHRLGVTHIIKLFADDPSYPGGSTRLPGVEYLVLPAEDRPDFDISQHFPVAMRFINAAQRSGGRVLVHCHAGVSRAPTIVLAYIMTYARLPLRLAWEYLRDRRPVIRPNPGFVRQLRQLDERLDRRRPAEKDRWPSFVS